MSRFIRSILLFILVVSFLTACAFSEETRFAFTTKDALGNTVTQDIFAQKDVTVLNIWATWCPPCVRELPELGAWQAQLPENAQLLLLCSDATYEASEVYEILLYISEVLGIKADTLLLTLDERLIDFLSFVEAVPTTLFIDRDGNILSDYTVVGAYVSQYAQNLNSILNP